MWENALKICTPDRWKSVVEHTEKIIDEWYQRQQILDDFPEFIINLDDDSSSSESDE